jgi:hypothetical protein
MANFFIIKLKQVSGKSSLMKTLYALTEEREQLLTLIANFKEYSILRRKNRNCFKILNYGHYCK